MWMTSGGRNGKRDRECQRVCPIDRRSVTLPAPGVEEAVPGPGLRNGDGVLGMRRVVEWLLLDG